MPEGHISDIEATFEGFIVPAASRVKTETAALLPDHGSHPSLPDTRCKMMQALNKSHPSFGWQALA